jgi:hypothetical protein
MLPLDIEVHESLDVDDDWLAVSVDQDMIQAQFAMHDGVLGPRPNHRGQLAQTILESFAVISDPAVPLRHLGDAS